VIPANIKAKTAKVKALLEEGTLNPSPGKVRDPKFQENEFFDPRDLVQVKYEMLRRVSVEKASVTEATEKYGVSRPTYYQTKASFDKGGLAGLVPRKRGPHGPHKLQRRGAGIRPAATRYGPARAGTRTGKAGSAEIRPGDTPQNDRAGGRWKKTPR
jgi:hypothetical protein